MTSRELTERQRQAIECMEEARSAGMTLSAYVRTRGLNLRAMSKIEPNRMIVRAAAIQPRR